MSRLIAIVGRPNVGKSSLFNRLIKRPLALVDDLPGVTRDRNYQIWTYEDREAVLIDTGGFDFHREDVLATSVTNQVMDALEECDLAVMVVDGVLGYHPEDLDIAKLIRKKGIPSIVAVNKIDSPEKEHNIHEFQRLGLEPIYAVSAAHGFGVKSLSDALYSHMEPMKSSSAKGRPRLSVIGRPNSGKSSLINRLIGSRRLVVDDTPGTTRDSVDVDIQVKGRDYTLVDTAGVRRKGRVSERLERISVLRALRSIEDSDMSLLLVDSERGLSDQDAHIAGYAFEMGKPLIILLNKIDLISDHKALKKDFQRERDLKMSYLAHSPSFLISAKTGKGLSPVFPMVDKIMAQYTFKATTAQVNKALEEATLKHSPPQAGKVRLKFYYATQVSTEPPSFVLFANRPKSVHFSYQRFLKNSFKKAFGLDLVPVRLFIRARHEDRHKK
ncbi:MAG: ribosome biogenesis GTPase Der [Deltaproteobacteria bacterium]|jgi:GTP-binding protein|nr:ribosome biogenesis GTPase Der [Deltaproteobacteria bacterium]